MGKEFWIYTNKIDESYSHVSGSAEPHHLETLSNEYHVIEKKAYDELKSLAQDLYGLVSEADDIISIEDNEYSEGFAYLNKFGSIMRKYNKLL